LHSLPRSCERWPGTPITLRQGARVIEPPRDHGDGVRFSGSHPSGAGFGSSCAAGQSDPNRPRAGVKARSLHPVAPSAPPIPTACDGDGELGCDRVAGDAA